MSDGHKKKLAEKQETKPQGSDPPLPPQFPRVTGSTNHPDSVTDNQVSSSAAWTNHRESFGDGTCWRGGEAGGSARSTGAPSRPLRPPPRSRPGFTCREVTSDHTERQAANRGESGRRPGAGAAVGDTGAAGALRFQEMGLDHSTASAAR